MLASHTRAHARKKQLHDTLA